MSWKLKKTPFSTASHCSLFICQRNHFRIDSYLLHTLLPTRITLLENQKVKLKNQKWELYQCGPQATFGNWRHLHFCWREFLSYASKSPLSRDYTWSKPAAERGEKSKADQQASRLRRLDACSLSKKATNTFRKRSVREEYSGVALGSAMPLRAITNLVERGAGQQGVRKTQGRRRG